MFIPFSLFYLCYWVFCLQTRKNEHFNSQKVWENELLGDSDFGWGKRRTLSDARGSVLSDHSWQAWRWI